MGLKVNDRSKFTTNMYNEPTTSANLSINSQQVKESNLLNVRGQAKLGILLHVPYLLRTFQKRHYLIAASEDLPTKKVFSAL